MTPEEVMERRIRIVDQMQGDNDYIIPTEAELERLIQSGHRLVLCFGTGGSAFRRKLGEPVDEAIWLLAKLRGVTTENVFGAGI